MTVAWSPALGIPVVGSPLLPMSPSHSEDARRIVRHAFARSGHMTWLGLDPGPRPGELTHALFVGGKLHASAAIVGRLRAQD